MNENHKARLGYSAYALGGWIGLCLAMAGIGAWSYIVLLPVSDVVMNYHGRLALAVKMVWSLHALASGVVLPVFALRSLTGSLLRRNRVRRLVRGLKA